MVHKHLIQLLVLWIFILIFGYVYLYRIEFFFSVPDLTGQKTIITGASEGIGFDLALEYAKAGSEVIAIARSQSKLQNLENEVRRLKVTGKIHTIRGDLSNFEGCEKAIIEALRKFEGKLDSIVLNHASYASHGWFVSANSSSERSLRINEAFPTNALSHFWITSMVLDSLKASPFGGRISVVSSMAGKLGMPKMVVCKYIRIIDETCLSILQN
jgi:NAD(P)-dependent dehydrogenase (short-subunit alcohol dehydrogenase family)